MPGSGSSRYTSTRRGTSPLAHRLGEPRCQVAEGQQQSPPGRRVGLVAESGHQRAGLGVAFGQGMDRLGLHAGIAGGAQQAPGRLRSPEAEQGGRGGVRGVGPPCRAGPAGSRRSRHRPARAPRRLAAGRSPGRGSTPARAGGATRRIAARPRRRPGRRAIRARRRHTRGRCAWRGHGGRPCRPRNGPGRSAAGSARARPGGGDRPIEGRGTSPRPAARSTIRARSRATAPPTGRARPARRPPEGDGPAPTPDRAPPATAGPGHPDGGSPVPRR